MKYHFKRKLDDLIIDEFPFVESFEWKNDSCLYGLKCVWGISFIITLLCFTITRQTITIKTEELLTPL